MTTQDRWREPTGLLKKLAAALNFEAEKLQLNEWPDELVYNVPEFAVARLALPEDKSQRAKRLDALDAIMLKLRDKYGPALTLQFKVSTAVVFTLDKNYDRLKLDEFYDDIKDGVFLTFYLKIDKSELLSYWNLTRPTAIVKLFLFRDALVRALSVPLHKLEQGEKALLKDATGEKKVFILVPEHEIALDGDYLAIVGGEAVARLRESTASTRPDPEEVKFFHEEAKDKLRWVQFELNHLTPRHLNVKWEKGKDGPTNDDPVARALYGQLFACSLLYMAGHSSLRNVKGDGQEEAAGVAADPLWFATFAADKYLTKFEIGDTTKLAEALVETSASKPWQAAQTVAKLAEWSYDVEKKRGVADRLSVLQNIIASSLQGNSPSINCRELASQAEELYTRAEVRHESFVQKELDKYLSQVKLLEDAIETTTKGYNEQVQTLTKSLTDNMLAAVAVVVGSFIAAIFKSPFEANVFWFGTGIYVAYLLIFPVIVGLTGARQRFNDSKDSFDKRKNEFAKRLTEKEVNQIVGQTVANRERWFKTWFLVTAVLYALVLCSVMLAIIKVPALIKSWSDSFELREVSYGEPATGDAVPLIIRGENFNNDKEIVVTIGDSKFTNTDGQTLKAHGSTVLTLSPRQQDLAAITDEGARFVSVRQGRAEPEKIELPEGFPPIPHPVFESWKRVSARGGTSFEAYGSNYSSISGISLGGAKLQFKVSENGRKLELTAPGAVNAPGAGQVVEVKLKNGETMQIPIATSPANARR